MMLPQTESDQVSVGLCVGHTSNDVTWAVVVCVCVTACVCVCVCVCDRPSIYDVFTEQAGDSGVKLLSSSC